MQLSTFPFRVFISRRERTDRRNALQANLAKNGLTGAEWFPALQCDSMRGDSRGFASLPKRSLALGKRLVLRTAGQQKVPALLLLEDDAVFHAEFADRIEALDLPEDWGLFYFGGLHMERPNLVSPGVVRARRILDNHAVAIRAEYYSAARAAMRASGKGCRGTANSDVLLSALHSGIPTYAAFPNLIWQSETFSDMAGATYSNYFPDGSQRYCAEVVDGFDSGLRPLVTAVMITGKNPVRRDMARAAVRCFERQTWPNRELLIINTGEALDTESPKVREVCLVQGNLTLGELRNLAFDHAQGDWLIQWNDDDWHHPSRIAEQMRYAADGAACVLRSQIRHSMIDGENRLYDTASGIHGTILHRRKIPFRYPSLVRAEDTAFLQMFPRRNVVPNEGSLYVRFHHGSNIWDREHIMGPGVPLPEEIRPALTRALIDFSNEAQSTPCRLGEPTESEGCAVVR